LRRTQIYQRDLACGAGKVHLRFALKRKYKNAERDWRWKYVFPAAKLDEQQPISTAHRNP